MGEEVVREVAGPPTYGMYYTTPPLCSDTVCASNKENISTQDRKYSFELMYVFFCLKNTGYDKAREG